MAGEEGMLVDVEIPVDIESAYDLETGLMKTVPVERKKSAPEIRPEEIDALRRDRDAERAARAAAERAAQEAAAQARDATLKKTETEAKAYGAHYTLQHNRLQELSTAISSTEALTNSAERELIDVETALADPNLEPAERAALAQRKVKAQREMARGESELVTLHGHKANQERLVAEAKHYWEGSAAQAAETHKQETTRQPEKTAVSDRFDPDQWLESVPSAVKPFLREHPEWRTDERLFRKMNRFADDYADDHGRSALDSKDFVAALTEKFYPQTEEDGGEVVEANDPPPRTRSAPAAPVSRSSTPSGAPTSSGKRGQVTLNAAQVRVAEEMYDTLPKAEAHRKYAQNLIRLRAEGRS